MMDDLFDWEKSDSPAIWYEGLKELQTGNRRAFYALLGLCPEMPRSFLDIGCGDGTLVEIMVALIGINQVMGIDLYHTSPLIHTADLNQPVELGRCFDLVTCWEVAEHIEPDSADILSSTIARHVGRWLIFTAGQPGQAGLNHINCQSVEYWREKFIALGLEYLDELTVRLKTMWSQIPAFEWLTNNVQIFERQKVEV